MRQVLGVRRELSLFSLAPSKLHAYLCGPSREIVANPASEYWLAFTDPKGAAYGSGPAVFEIEFKHWSPDPGAGRHGLALHPPGELTKEQSAPLVEGRDLLNRFGALLGTSTHVDIAVAWARPGPAVERLVKHARRVKTRIAVGLSGNNTEPATLRRMMAIENVELRVARPPGGAVFHPKFYRFCGEQGAICWIGSANFTRGGFGGNTELVHEFKDRLDVGGEWFERLWNGSQLSPATRRTTGRRSPRVTGEVDRPDCLGCRALRKSRHGPSSLPRCTFWTITAIVDSSDGMFWAKRTATCTR